MASPSNLRPKSSCGCEAFQSPRARRFSHDVAQVSIPIQHARASVSDQSAFVPIVAWAAAVLLIAVAANRSRRSTVTASPDAAGYLRTRYLRTLGLITYPLYLTHNVIGSAIVRVLVDAGLHASLAVSVGLGMLVLVCWLICAKIEPAIGRLLREIISNFGLLPKTTPPSSLPRPAPGLRPSAAYASKR